jgi:hypothetical protein
MAPERIRLVAKDVRRTEPGGARYAYRQSAWENPIAQSYHEPVADSTYTHRSLFERDFLLTMY